MKYISMESLRYQVRDSFHANLTAIIENIYKDMDDGLFTNNKAVLESDYGRELEKLIRDRFGMNVILDPLLSEVSYLAIVPFSSDQINKVNVENINNISAMVMPVGAEMKQVMKRMQAVMDEAKEDAARINGMKGIFDLRLGRVSGYPSEVRHHLLLNFVFTRSVGLTAAETSAVAIHECGHAFQGLLNHHRVLTTNHVFSEIAGEVNNNRPDKAMAIYRRNFGADDFTKAMTDKTPDIEDFYGAAVNRYVDIMQSQYLDSGYDSTSFEYLADSFAVKLGAGDDLSTGLHKIETLSNFGKNLSSVPYRMISGFFTVLMSVVYTGIAFALGLGFLPIAAAIFILYRAYKTSNDKIRARYDDFKDRYTRMLQGINNILKNQDLPKDEVSLLLKQWDTINEISALNRNDAFPLVQFFEWLNPTKRRDNRMKGHQQNIEALMNNSLFAKTAKLNSLGD